MTKFLFLTNCACFGLNFGTFIATGNPSILAVAILNGAAVVFTHNAILEGR